MQFVADLHIHSHYSIATSKNLLPEYLDLWAEKKGIHVLGTGDISHPGWLRELKEKLYPAEPGLFTLKKEYRIHESVKSGFDTRFLLTGEISTIYKKGGRVRKVHNLVMLPNFSAAEQFQQRLEKIGNIRSDGRPILGLDARDLLEILLEVSEEAALVPAHIWTPWFSALGAKSGFDSIEACYGDLSGNIFAVETGLSSDPPMNWICTFLDNFTIISNSDAHSPEKLGREANLFDTELSYPSILSALRTPDSDCFRGTIEFFPQEGKYHFDGHRKCGITWSPSVTREHGGICPVCGKPVTIGVMNRVSQLADREEPTGRPGRKDFFSLIPLKEVLSEILEAGPQTKRVSGSYEELITKAGSELSLLMQQPLEEVERFGGKILREAVRRIRKREVIITEGFDGEFGRIHVFTPGEKKNFGGQTLLFSEGFTKRTKTSPVKQEPMSNNVTEYVKTRETNSKKHGRFLEIKGLYNAEQAAAVHDDTQQILILAGPGTGKTRTLIERIVYLIREKHCPPEKILSVTFSNKAAGEIRRRLISMLEDPDSGTQVWVGTFHALGLFILKENLSRTGRSADFTLIDETAKRFLLSKTGSLLKSSSDLSAGISRIKQLALDEEEIEDIEMRKVFSAYQNLQREFNVFDLDDLLYLPIQILKKHSTLLKKYQRKWEWLHVDEYQDINRAQYLLTRLLFDKTANRLCLIGDPNQAIYGFRGADSAFIREVLEAYSGVKTHRLLTSYRCSQTILDASRQVIAAQTDGGGEGKPSGFLTGLHEGVKIRITETGTEKSEAEFIARTIERMIGGLRTFSFDSNISDGTGAEGISSLSDFAVLVRTARQMRVIEKALEDHAVPYQSAKAVTLFASPAVKIALLIMNICVNPSQSLIRQILREQMEIHIQSVENIRSGIGPETAACEILEKIAELMNTAKELEMLIDLSREFGKDVNGFLRYAAMGSEVDVLKHHTEKVSILTLHASKGLEFPCVFIAGCEDGLLPYMLHERTETDIAEERRLFYVGMTRAKQYLYLTRAKSRYIYGHKQSFKQSRFVKAIAEELLESEANNTKKKEKTEYQQLELF